jgi:hypothetical protein
MDLLPHRKYSVRGQEMYFYYNDDDTLVFYFYADGKIIYYRDSRLMCKDLKQINNPIIMANSILNYSQ